MTSIHRQISYGLLAVVGLFATWYYNLIFIEQTGGFSVPEFISATYSNAASASISNDLLVVVVAFAVWSFVECRRLGMRFWWAYMILMFSVAIAVSYPLFLLMRERKLQSQSG